MTTTNGATPAPPTIIFRDNGQDTPHIGRWYTHYKTGVPASHLEQITGHNYKDLLNIFTRHNLELVSNDEREEKFIQLSEASRDHIIYWYELYKSGVSPRELLLASCRKKLTELEQLFNSTGLLILLDEQLEERRAEFRKTTQINPTPAVAPNQPRPTDKPEKKPIALAAPKPPTPAVVKPPQKQKKEAVHLTVAQVEEVHRRYMNEEPMSHISRDWKLPEHVLYYQFQKHGLPLRGSRKEPPPPKWTPEQLNELNQLYLSGSPLATLEQKAGYTIKTIKKAFAQAGLPTVRPRTPPELPAPPEQSAPAETKEEPTAPHPTDLLQQIMELKQRLERVGCVVNVTVNVTVHLELKE
jgi:hypothetical protein